MKARSKILSLGAAGLLGGGAAMLGLLGTGEGDAGSGRPSLAELSRPWSSAPLGICITNVACDGFGVTVDFETDLPPPYRVGVHLVDEIGYGSSRLRPVNYIDTDSHHAFVAGRFYDLGVFVQVYQRGPETTGEGTDHPATRLDELEWEQHVAKIRSIPVRKIDEPNWDNDPSDRSLDGYDPSEMVPVGDWTWAGFVRTESTSLMRRAVSLTASRLESGRLAAHFTTNDFSGTRPSADIGSGFRLLLFDCGQGLISTLTQPAYSARTNMSEAVLIKRGLRSLSAHDGWKFTSDSAGSPVVVPARGVPQDRIDWKGL